MTSTMSEAIILTPSGKRRGRKPGLNSTIAQRGAANARERSRMRVLSGAFIDLKSALPWVPRDTKLSKLDTLKLAAGYIAYLRRVLDIPVDEGETSNDTEGCEVKEAHPVQLFGLVAQSHNGTGPLYEAIQNSNHIRKQSEQPIFSSGMHMRELTSSSQPKFNSTFSVPPQLPNICTHDIQSNKLQENLLPVNFNYPGANHSILAHRLLNSVQGYPIGHRDRVSVESRTSDIESFKDPMEQSLSLRSPQRIDAGSVFEENSLINTESSGILVSPPRVTWSHRLTTDQMEQVQSIRTGYPSSLCQDRLPLFHPRFNQATSRLWE